MSYEISRDVSITSQGYVRETISYRPPQSFPDIMDMIRSFRTSDAITTYKRRTECGVRTAIIAVRHASKGIPGYCDDCGKKETALFADECRNSVHDEVIRTRVDDLFPN